LEHCALKLANQHEVCPNCVQALVWPSIGQTLSGIPSASGLAK